MRVLTLDIGNSTVDACSWEEGELKHLGRFTHLDLSVARGSWDRVLAVSVRPSVEEDLIKTFGRTLRVISLEDIPIKVDYKTPETLGTDRVLFAYAVREFYGDSAVLVSAGTALVVDLLTEGVFRGGFITAGVSLKLKALNRFTEGIPGFKPRRTDLPIGRSTEECVVGGAFEESRAFVREVIGRWRESTGKDLKVVVTGGEGWVFEDMGIYDPLILHRGMLRIGGYL
ncbi:MAG: type III pantothenate kinase [Aquificota bacterium]|nr:type III pantothenate kinase [Aquificota bacterium]MDQ7081983.1 type III pantothenate kinase [Aquificota bacterium]